MEGTLLGSRPDIVGQTIDLSGIPTTVIGVLPADFQFAPSGGAEFYARFQARSARMRSESRLPCGLYGVARLKDGVSVESALAEMQSPSLARLEKQYPDTNRSQGAIVEPLSEVIVRGQIIERCS